MAKTMEKEMMARATELIDAAKTLLYPLMDEGCDAALESVYNAVAEALWLLETVRMPKAAVAGESARKLIVEEVAGKVEELLGMTALTIENCAISVDDMCEVNAGLATIDALLDVYQELNATC